MQRLFHTFLIWHYIHQYSFHLLFYYTYITSQFSSWKSLSIGAYTILQYIEYEYDNNSVNTCYLLNPTFLQHHQFTISSCTLDLSSSCLRSELYCWSGKERFIERLSLRSGITRDAKINISDMAHNNGISLLFLRVSRTTSAWTPSASFLNNPHVSPMRCDMHRHSR